MVFTPVGATAFGKTLLQSSTAIFENEDTLCSIIRSYSGDPETKGHKGIVTLLVDPSSQSEDSEAGEWTRGLGHSGVWLERFRAPKIRFLGASRA